MNRIMIVIVILFLLFIVVIRITSSNTRETFQQIPSQYGYYDPNDLINHHPDQSTMARAYYENIFETPNATGFINPMTGSSYFSDLDPDTLKKLQRTIVVNGERQPTSVEEVAYNDLGSYEFTPGEVRPYNDIETRISEARVDNLVEINDDYDNNYYRTWLATDAKNNAKMEAHARDIYKNELECINYKKINQCMSTCADTPHCRGFVLNKNSTPEKNGKCCMLVEPAFNYHKYSLNQVPNNDDYTGYRYLNTLLKEKAKKENMPIFTRVKDQDNNSVYNVPVTRPECKKYCPKCISGICPPDYRCVDMRADPRYNQTCLITNEDRYNELLGLTFDSDKIPYLEEKYGLDEYAGYDDLNMIRITHLPETYRLKLRNGILPNKFDPTTWGRGKMADEQISAIEKAEQDADEKPEEKETKKEYDKAFIKAAKKLAEEYSNPLTSPKIAEGFRNIKEPFRQGYPLKDPGKFKLPSRENMYWRYVKSQPTCVGGSGPVIRGCSSDKISK